MTALFRSIAQMPGVGEARAAKYHRLGIETPYDLLRHYPRTYIDFTAPAMLADAEPGVPAAFRLQVVSRLPVSFARNNFSIYRVAVTDGRDECLLVFFNTPYPYKTMKLGDTYYVYGKITGGFTRWEIHSPQVQRAEDAMPLLPVYPQTTGLTSAAIRTNAAKALSYLDGSTETLPPALLEAYGLMTMHAAFNGIHRPRNTAELEAARHRLMFEELLQFQLGTLMIKNNTNNQTACVMHEVPLDDFYAALPFTLTNAQHHAVGVICKGMCSTKPMNRLLQGDVGSGKTVVAAAAAAFAAKNGFQTVLMAPTEILAQQHLQTMSAFLAPLGVIPQLLTGSTKAKEKRQIKEQLANGTLQVVVGTHAVIQKDIEFKQLGLVITDEQHRFGVAQRAALAGKGGYPHKLVMSATPIPRTLALIFYGDLDITILDEMPKGRLPIQTFAVTGGFRERIYSFIRQRLDTGEQAYLVCAMIEDSDALENVQAAQTYAEQMKTGPFRDYRVGMLHGKMKAAEKEKVMGEMKNHTIDLLVCTTVVEVGVDVPNATVIVIENADRFGMAQLHQLRGRVGRGTQQSYCILITDSKREDSRERLKILSRTANGFAIAEQDLKLRGPGDFFGNAQHGMFSLMYQAMSGNMPLFSETQMAAQQILEQDPELRSPEMQALRTAVIQLFARNDENGFN